MKKYGLIGYPLGHSFSKDYFTKKFEREGLTDCVYEIFPLPNLSGFEDLIRSEPDLCGLNVTIPHKIGVMFYLTEIDEAAKAIDAVNCIKVVNARPAASFFSGEVSSMNVKLIGYNTDAYGFEKSLSPLLKSNHTKALVLGTGGASRAVTYVLQKLHIEYILVSRRSVGKQLKYADLNQEIIESHPLIINTSPVGMAPHIDECPDIPYEYLSSQHLLYDLIYNPEKTEFLKRGEAKGAAIKNGMEMLQLQAEKAWEIWNSEA